MWICLSSSLMPIVLALILGLLLVSTSVTATCTPDALLALDLTLCSKEIRSQYDWRFNSSVDDPITCEPWNIVIVHDSSDTVRRSIKYGVDNFMEPLESLYVETFFNVFQPNITNDTMAYVTFATQPYTYIDFGELPIHSEFLNKALDWVNDPTYNDPFWTASHRGWTDMSNAMVRLQELLVPRTNPENTLVILMSDGHPENRGSPELAEAITQANILRSMVNGTIHIHCLVMRFDDESKIFWRNEELCDSKELITTVPGVKPHKLVDNLDYWAQRSSICTTNMPTSAPTTPTNHPTFVPTSNPTGPTSIPTTSPSARCPDGTTFLPARFDLANLTINNLCGMTGDPINYYKDIFIFNPFLTYLDEQFTDIDVVLECNRTLSPGYDIINPTTPMPGTKRLGRVQLTPGLSITFTIKFVNSTTGLPYNPLGIGLRLFDIDQDSLGRNETIVVCEYDEQITQTVALMYPLSGNLSQAYDVPRPGCVTLTSRIPDVPPPTDVQFESVLDQQQRSVAASFIFRTSEVTLTFEYDDPTASSPLENFIFMVSLDTNDCPDPELGL